jgi:hypothetical protein
MARLRKEPAPRPKEPSCHLNNTNYVYSIFFWRIFEGRQPKRTSSSLWDYTILARGKAMDSGKHWTKDPPANEQESAHA